MSYLPIRTSRLSLREFVQEDWRSVHCYASDQDVVRYQEWGPNTEADSLGFVDRVIALSKVDPRVDFELAIVLHDESRLIGAASIHISNIKNREGWIGYCLNKQFWGKGLATEAAKTLIKFGFSELGLHRIFATADPRNTASANVLRKLGMKHEGLFRENKFVRGQWRDTDLYAVLATDLVER